jgi:hypothetical protein
MIVAVEGKRLLLLALFRAAGWNPGAPFFPPPGITVTEKRAWSGAECCNQWAARTAEAARRANSIARLL